jgi:hypothetical protein
MKNIKSGFIVFCLALLIFAFSSGAAAYAPATSCAVSPTFDYPLMPDVDCDGVIDRLDNCPLITNPAQKDADENGLGDACDFFVESLGTSPSDFVFNGRGFTVTGTFLNNRDYNIRNARIRVLIPDLGIESVQYMDNLNPCESRSMEFTLRAPACAAEAEYPVFIEATYMNIIGDQEKTGAVTSIRVIPDNYCKQVLAGNGILGNTFVDVMEIQDVYKGGEAVYPIKISNREEENKDYVISVTGLDGWGRARLSPNSLVIVPAGTDRIVDLYVSANDAVPPGERVFVVSIKSGEEYQRFLLIANVKERPIQNNNIFLMFGFKMILIIILALLVLAAILAGASRMVKPASKPETRVERYY